MISRSVKKELKEVFREIQMNLENNYKETALQAKKEAELLIMKYKNDGTLTEKDYMKYRSLLNKYEEKFKEYELKNK